VFALLLQVAAKISATSAWALSIVKKFYDTTEKASRKRGKGGEGGL
jgi:hypothetical protein